MSTRERGPLLGMLLWDAGLPLLCFYGLRALGSDEWIALLAGAACAVLRLAWGVLRRRSVDGFAALLAAVLVIALVLSFVSGDARFVLLKESFGTAAAAVVLLVSCASARPLVLVAVRAGASEAKRAEIDELCDRLPRFRRAFTRMTAVWGTALLLEAAARVPLVLLVPVDAAVALSLVLLLAVIGVLSAWTAWYAGRVHARADAVVAVS